MPSAADLSSSAQYAHMVRYARVHQCVGLAIGLVILTVCDVAFGSQILTFPGHAKGVPMRRELPIAFAALAASSLHSRMDDLECAAAAVRAYERWHLLTVSVAATLLVGGTEWVVSGPDLAVVLSRALLIWLGLALISGRLFGRRLSWILPVSTIFPLTFLNQDEVGRVRWWDWTGQPMSALGCWAIAVLCVIAGLFAFFLTPWRLKALQMNQRSRRSSTAEGEG